MKFQLLLGCTSLLVSTISFGAVNAQDPEVIAVLQNEEIANVADAIEDSHGLTCAPVSSADVRIESGQPSGQTTFEITFSCKDTISDRRPIRIIATGSIAYRAAWEPVAVPTGFRVVLSALESQVSS